MATMRSERVCSRTVGNATAMTGFRYGSDGGVVGVVGNDGKPRVSVGVNEYGNGGVGTWGKDGYKTGNLP